MDDDHAILDGMRLILEYAGFETILFTNGNDLLKGRYELPDLFIIDKQLSGVSGLDICRHLKKQPASQDIPVIIISASLHVRRMAQEAGADDFIEKPFRMQDLVGKVAGLLAVPG